MTAHFGKVVCDGFLELVPLTFLLRCGGFFGGELAEGDKQFSVVIFPSIGEGSGEVGQEGKGAEGLKDLLLEGGDIFFLEGGGEDVGGGSLYINGLIGLDFPPHAVGGDFGEAPFPGLHIEFAQVAPCGVPLA